jgi:flagellar hook-associated protein 1 FlgK
MASTFMGLSIAGRGLSASQAGLATTTNNMSNISTTGYSRQVVNQVSIGPAAIYSSSSVGAGAEVTSVDRVRSFRLDQKYWQDNGTSSKWEAKATYLEQIESVFGTSGDNDISTAMDDFSSALEDLSSDVTSSSNRAVVLEKAIELCETINDAAAQLTQLRSDINSDVKTTVEQINSYSTQIAALNQQITVVTASGGSANELEDQRGLLVDQLSALVDVNVTETDAGSYTITVGGSTLVNGDKANQLECYTVTDTDSDQYGMYGIRWTATGEEFDSGDSGALSGYLELRDGTGTGADSKGIPYYISQLDEFARTLAEDFNEGVDEYSGHADGVGTDDLASTGTRFFSYSGESSADLTTLIASEGTDAAYSNITAANLCIATEVQADTDLIAAASADGGDGNDENVLDLISIIDDDDNIGDFYDTIIATVATASSYAQTEETRTSAITSYIDDSRSSVSGVSSDEETVNLTVYQAAYAASAAMVTTWNEIYQTTIDMVND